MRPASPSPSASGSIGLSFSSSTNSVAKPRANFWDFEAYSRSFLHEKKLIEKEKEEWERKVEERRSILKKSIDFYTEKYQKLAEQSFACSSKVEAFCATGGSVTEAQNEIKRAEQEVEKIQSLLKYFKGVQRVLINSEAQKEEEFRNDLIKQDWKSALDKLILLGEEDPELQSSNLHLSDVRGRLFTERLGIYSETMAKRIKTYVEGLGWPKIVSNEESAEIISRLQEVLTYGEALYILSTRSSLSNAQVAHPIKFFIDPIKLRFDYHFNSDRPTNQLDKPEWYFDHLLGVCRETVSFLREFITPCWRLRDLDDYLRDGIIEISIAKTRDNLKNCSSRHHHLMEMGKFLQSIKDEFGYTQIEGVIEQVFVESHETFVEFELERVKSEYSKLFEEDADEWTCPNVKAPQMGEPSAAVLKFLSFFHSSTISPYSFIKKDMKLRSLLLVKVQSWLLEAFHDKCLFDCSPLHTSRENILKDIGMINSLALICKVLGDDFGESIDYLELSSREELHELIGYDPSALRGTCFNRAIEAFKVISDKLSSHVFNYVMEKFLKNASAHANAMVYANCEDGNAVLSENLRLAVANVIESVNFIKPFLCPQRFKKLFHQTLPEKLAAFMFQGVLLKNFFNANGAERFSQDLQYMQDTLSHVIDPGNLKESFAKVYEATEILKIKEKDPTGPFDGLRLSRAIKENRVEELKRFLELLRFSHLRVEELSQIFASRRH